MGIGMAAFLGQDLLTTALMLVGPAIAASLIVGLTVSILQTVTSIQEQTMTFAPRIVAVSVVMIITAPWALQVLKNYTERTMQFAVEALH